MKKNLLFAVILTLIFTETWAQTKFEKGYFIDESDERVHCLIRNRDWNRNPHAFEYKLTDNDGVKTAGIETIKEFGIPGSFRYIRATVNIDKSGDLTSEISNVREPLFHEETIFLKVLVEGEALLFLYSEKNLTRFFFKTRESEIKQLIYKRYVEESYRVSVNLDYRNQLFSNFNKQGITIADIQKVNYLQSDLESFFMKANGTTDKENTNNRSKGVFNLSLRPGINIHNLTIKHKNFDSMETDFGSDINFRFGVELEFILPFNNNKWALIAEPTYRYYFPEAPSAKTFISKVNHKSIDVPAGIRHYFFLNDKSKIFANACIGYDLTNNSNLTIYFGNDGRTFDSWKIITGTYLAAGLGYKYNNRYSLEARYFTNRNILSLNKDWFSNYKTFFVTLGYSLF